MPHLSMLPCTSMPVQHLYLLKTSSISLKGVFQTHEQKVSAARDNLQGGHILSILHMQCLRKALWAECMLMGSVCTH